jgi:hypothetical protein
LEIAEADDFTYVDSVDKLVSQKVQGIRIIFKGEARGDSQAQWNGNGWSNPEGVFRNTGEIGATHSDS